MRNKIYLVFLWHMHQPLYKDALSGRYILPWVRLHGSKDYLDMVTILDSFPRIRQNINVVPSLLYQLNEYIEGKADDLFLSLSLKPAHELTNEDKTFILKNFFLAAHESMIRPFPRFYSLLRKRGLSVSEEEASNAARFFSLSDFIDLQVLFNLAWIDPVLRKQDTILTELERKGSGYTEEDKKTVIDAQIRILKRIVPVYRKMHMAGKIELSVTPFYHPILPLLCDTDSAREGLPGVKLPAYRFSHKEDAAAQIRLAIEYFEKLFGFRPEGMWPSEGSVSADAVRLIRENGIKWIATDEAVLAASLKKNLRDTTGRLIEPDRLYTDYVHEDVSIIFRDHDLSDQIGFVYSSWDADRAARDFYRKLEQVISSSPVENPRMVSVMLDGENAWEYYRKDGYDFLSSLYKLLDGDERIECITVSEYLKKHSAGKRLERLHAGSWIYGNFAIWIGQEEDNTAWDYISRTRNDLVRFAGKPGVDAASAWNFLYAAEGSDWFWWYGGDHSTENAREFDELFRHNLMAVYRALSEEPPDFLYVPVLKRAGGVKSVLPIRGFIHPEIDGRVTSYFEWLEGTYVSGEKSSGSMHKTETFVSRLYYGFDRETLYIRVDGNDQFGNIQTGLSFALELSMRELHFTLDTARGNVSLSRNNGGESSSVPHRIRYAVDEILEIALPFADLGAGEGDEISFYIRIYSHGREIERFPLNETIRVRLPSPDFDMKMWY